MSAVVRPTLKYFSGFSKYNTLYSWFVCKRLTMLTLLVLASQCREAVGSLGLSRQAYGVYDREGGHSVADYPFTRGQAWNGEWAVVNPARGVFNFEALDALAQIAVNQNQVFIVQICPICGAVGNSMPPWMFPLGVTNITDGVYTYGYYLEPLFKTFFREMVMQLAKHMREELSTTIRNSLAFVRVDTGHTGDEQPYEEPTHIPVQYQINSDAWRTHRLWVFETFRVSFIYILAYKC
jgi:hypothetical protein